jgi:hypothetical protein
LGGYSTSDWHNADPAAQPSIIDGDRNRRGVRIEGHLMPTVTLQGLTIQNGHGMTEGGGGILIKNGTVIVQNCLITNSTTTLGSGKGGGINIDGGGEVFLKDNIIQSNNATGGGGINVWNTEVTMRANTLRDNAAFFGGGLQVRGNNAKVTMNGNRIIGSQAGGFQGTGILLGGGIIDGRNDVIAQSFSGNGEGEGVYVEGGPLTARHWTVVDNERYGVVTAGGTAYLTNTIVASHTVAALSGNGVEANTTLFYDNSTNCDGDAVCVDSRTGDPKFISPSTGDYHIMASSAAIDTGIDAGVTTDIDGDPRPALLGYDIGADEFGLWLYLPSILK